MRARYCFVVGALIAATAKVMADALPSLAAILEAGQEIYQKGTGTERRSDLARESLSCMNCHGRSGQGKREGGVLVPPITWNVLSASGNNSSGARAAYDEASLRRAVMQGISTSGAPLNAVMVRYTFTDPQWHALYTYLQVLGTSKDRDPGVGENTLRIGTVLTLNGPSGRLGKDVRAAIEAAFSRVNAQGGIFGRKLVLVVQDAGPGRHSQLNAIRKLLSAVGANASGGVFALVAPMLQTGAPEIAEMIDDTGIPMIGPLVSTPDEPKAGTTYYLLPSLLEQTNALLTHLFGQRTGGASNRLMLLHDGSVRSIALTERALRWSSEHDIQVVIQANALSPTNDLARRLQSERVDACLYIGANEPLKRISATLQKSANRFPIGVHANMLGPHVAELPVLIIERLVLAHPAIPSDHGQPEGKKALPADIFLSQQGNGLQAIAVAAANVLIEATKRSGRNIDRERFTTQLDNLRDLSVGTLLPVTFAPSDHVGSHRVAIVRFDPITRQLVDASVRISLRP